MAPGVMDDRKLSKGRPPAGYLGLERPRGLLTLRKQAYLCLVEDEKAVNSPVEKLGIMMSISSRRIASYSLMGSHCVHMLQMRHLSLLDGDSVFRPY